MQVGFAFIPIARFFYYFLPANKNKIMQLAALSFGLLALFYKYRAKPKEDRYYIQLTPPPIKFDSLPQTSNLFLYQGTISKIEESIVKWPRIKNYDSNWWNASIADDLREELSKHLPENYSIKCICANNTTQPKVPNPCWMIGVHTFGFLDAQKNEIGRITYTTHLMGNMGVYCANKEQLY